MEDLASWSPDWRQMLSHLWHLGMAYVLAFPIGWDRESEARGVGLRTFPLVAMGACAFMLMGIAVLDGSEAEARVMYGLITGIGFIGGGAIVKSSDHVSGTATAASLWNTGAIGTSVAWDLYEIAVILSALNFFTLRYVKRFTGERKEAACASTERREERVDSATHDVPRHR